MKITRFKHFGEHFWPAVLDWGTPLHFFQLFYGGAGDELLPTRSVGGVPTTVYTPRGATAQGEFALDVAARAVDFYSEWFGTAYTLPKLDLVAVPDFYIGAMENWGLLTFR